MQASRRAAWSSTIAAATGALAAVMGLLVATLSVVDLRMDSLVRWGVPFGFGVFASILAFLLSAFFRRRIDSRQAEREKP
ncbi:MAG: hypothetical protein ACRD2N_00590 [Vicinamibacterales bacterium]